MYFPLSYRGSTTVTPRHTVPITNCFIAYY